MESIHSLVFLLGQQETVLVDIEYRIRRMKLVLTDILQGIQYAKGSVSFEYILQQIEDAWPYVNADVDNSARAVRFAIDQAEVARSIANPLMIEVHNSTAYHIDSAALSGFNSDMAQLDSRIHVLRESISALVQDTNDFVQIFGNLRGEYAKQEISSSLTKTLRSLLDSSNMFSELVADTNRLVSPQKAVNNEVNARDRLVKAASNLMQ